VIIAIATIITRQTKIDFSLIVDQTFFLVIAAIVAIVVIIWKPAYIVRSERASLYKTGPNKKNGRRRRCRGPLTLC